MDELERPRVGDTSLLGTIETPQELRPRRVQVVVAVELETVGDRERGLGVARLGNGNGRLSRRRRSRSCERAAVQGRELRPVLRLLGVKDGDRRLHHVRTPAAERQRAIQASATLR